MQTASCLLSIFIKDILCNNAKRFVYYSQALFLNVQFFMVVYPVL